MRIIEKREMDVISIKELFDSGIHDYFVLLKKNEDFHVIDSAMQMIININGNRQVNLYDLSIQEFQDVIMSYDEQWAFIEPFDLYEQLAFELNMIFDSKKVKEGKHLYE